MQPVYDKHGRQIKHGDLLKTFHFVAALRRQRQYLYHVVRVEPSEGRYMQAIPCHELATGMDKGGRFWLLQSIVDRMDVEVIQCSGAEFLPERPKDRPKEI